MAAALAGCASAPPAAGPDGRSVVAPIEIGGDPYEALWQLPTAQPRVLLLLQHGFTRRCSHLQTTARWLMADGVAVLCVNASMAGGNPLLADALAAVLAGTALLPDGRPLPRRLVVGGHSAGAAFAVHLGARFDTLAPGRLAGALLFDPVATRGFADDLRAVAAGRPLLSIVGAASACNAQRNADAALRDAAAEVVDPGPGSNHLDAEGDDSDALGRAACGRPLPQNTARLRAQAAQWLQMLR